MDLHMDGVVVVPIDFSDGNVGAVKTALQLATDPASVHLVHVTQPPEHTAYGFPYESPIDPTTLNEAIGGHFREYAENNGFGELTRAIRTGDAGAEIVEYANETNAKLIVIPSHGYHGLTRFLLGSVAERVLRLAECPVMVLRRKENG